MTNENTYYAGGAHGASGSEQKAISLKKHAFTELQMNSSEQARSHMYGSTHRSGSGANNGFHQPAAAYALGEDDQIAS